MSVRGILLLMAIMIAASASAQTRRSDKRPLPTRERIAPAIPATAFDTIFAPTDSTVRLAGFEKPLRSYRESLFVRNNSDDTIKGLRLTLDYRDPNGNAQLHSRTVTLHDTIPPHSTRHIHFASWDRQNAFYYIHSSRPLRAQASPFDVRIDIIFILK